MKHSDLKVGMKVKLVREFDNSFIASLGEIVTVKSIDGKCF